MKPGIILRAAAPNTPIVATILEIFLSPSKRNENKSLNEASLHDCMISQLQSYVASNPPTEFSFEEQADYYRGAMNYALNACKDNVYIAKDTQTKNFG